MCKHIINFLACPALCAHCWWAKWKTPKNKPFHLAALPGIGRTFTSQVLQPCPKRVRRRMEEVFRSIKWLQLSSANYTRVHSLPLFGAVSVCVCQARCSYISFQSFPFPKFPPYDGFWVEQMGGIGMAGSHWTSGIIKITYIATNTHTHTPTHGHH